MLIGTSKKNKFILILLCLAFYMMIFKLPTSVQADSTTYYVDAVNGDDNNSGTSTSSAWKTLDKVNGNTFDAGTSILFKCGQQWTGHLIATSSGESGFPVTYGSYGTGNKPVICGTGLPADKYVIYIRDQQYVEITGLNIITNMTKPDTYYRTGIMIANSTTGTINHVYVMNCEISNIYTCKNPDAGARAFGGITITSWASKDSIFNDILINGNYIHDLNYAGIYECTVNDTNYAWDTQTRLRSTNVKFSNNTVQNCQGDAIVIGNTTNAICENNLVINSPCSNDGNFAGIWAAYHNNCIYQNNEVYGITGGKYDCVAFDDDINSYNNVFQYNYSHNNLNGASMSMGNDSAGVYRYNISKDETPGKGGSNAAIPNMYNNVFYVSPGLSIDLGTSGISSYSKNNIFVNSGKIRWDMRFFWSISNNCFYGNIIEGGRNGIMRDPMFTNPGRAANGISSCSGFQLRSGSPCIGAGLSISDNGGKDFFGNMLYEGDPDIGVNETAKGISSITGSYEAESPGNTRTGKAVVKSVSNTSGGKVVANVGNGSQNAFTFNNIMADKDDSYTLTLYYVNSKAGAISMSVNGGSASTVILPSMGSWAADGSVNISVKLKSGSNTIKFSNNSAYTVSLDRIVVSDKLTATPKPKVSPVPAAAPPSKPAAGTNMMVNPGFEQDGKATPTPAGWAVWSSNGGENASFTESDDNAYEGKYYLKQSKDSVYNATTYQTLNYLEKGTYKLTAYVKSSGGQKQCYVYIKNYGGDQLQKNIPVTSEWTQISIDNVRVTTGICEIGFWSDANASNWMCFDKVEFVKKQG